MKNVDRLLAILFVLIGAHVPKSFSLLYLAFILTIWMSLVFPVSLSILPRRRLLLFRAIQFLVLIFSCSYSLSMVHFGFWELSGRQLLDFISSLLLPNSLIWAGFYLARRDQHLLANCLLGYCLGALGFLLAALVKTWGFSWFSLHDDPASLLVAWGSERSMNVRSIEQNGILNIVLGPIALFYVSQRRAFLAFALSSLAALGLLSVLPLVNGRLWIASLLIASLPLVFRLVLPFAKAGCSLGKGIFIAGIFSVAAAASVAFRPYLNLYLCDERFAIYAGALRDWRVFISGGRGLSFTVFPCNSMTPLHVSMTEHVPGSLTMLHSVPFDIIASVGIFPFLPLSIILSVALCLTAQLFVSLCATPIARLHCNMSIFFLWAFISALVPQWLFQPLLYSDGLLYYMSFFALGALAASSSVYNETGVVR